MLAAGHLVDDVHEALALHGPEAGVLAVEITEGQLMADPARAQQTLQRLGCDMVQGYLLAQPLAPALMGAQLPRRPSDQAGPAAR